MYVLLRDLMGRGCPPVGAVTTPATTCLHFARRAGDADAHGDCTIDLG
jgi:hypothetical protein